MLADPCNAPTVPGAFGDVSLRVHKEVKSFAVVVQANKSFDLLWLPQYHCKEGGVHGMGANVLAFQAAHDEQMWNTSGTPWGNFDNGVTTYTHMSDPCADFVNNEGVRDARTIAACIDVEYTGRSDTEAGQVGSFVAKLGSFWGQKAGEEYTSLAVYDYNDVLNLCNNVARPSTGATVKWVPNFAANALAFQTVGESPIAIGESGTASTDVSETRLREDDPSVIGVAITGAADVQTYRITLTKIIESRDSATIGGLRGAGQTITPPKVTPLERASKQLSGTGSQADDSWQTKALNGLRIAGNALMDFGPGLMRGFLEGPSPSLHGLGAIPRSRRLH